MERVINGGNAGGDGAGNAVRQGNLVKTSGKRRAGAGQYLGQGTAQQDAGACQVGTGIGVAIH